MRHKDKNICSINTSLRDYSCLYFIVLVSNHVMLNCLIFNTGEVLHVVLQCKINCSKEKFTGIYLFIRLQ